MSIEDKNYINLIQEMKLNILFSSNGVYATGENGHKFYGENLKSCLDNVLENKNSSLDKQKFNQFHVGQSVKILPKKTPLIKSYNGMNEGFPEEIIGKIGVIVDFDRFTKSQKTVIVLIDGKEYQGSHIEIISSDN